MHARDTLISSASPRQTLSGQGANSHSNSPSELQYGALSREDERRILKGSIPEASSGDIRRPLPSASRGGLPRQGHCTLTISRRDGKGNRRAIDEFDRPKKRAVGKRDRTPTERFSFATKVVIPMNRRIFFAAAILTLSGWTAWAGPKCEKCGAEVQSKHQQCMKDKRIRSQCNRDMKSPAEQCAEICKSESPQYSYPAAFRQQMVELARAMTQCISRPRSLLGRRR